MPLSLLSHLLDDVTDDDLHPSCITLEYTAFQAPISRTSCLHIMILIGPRSTNPIQPAVQARSAFKRSRPARGPSLSWAEVRPGRGRTRCPRRSCRAGEPAAGRGGPRPRSSGRVRNKQGCRFSNGQLGVPRKFVRRISLTPCPDMTDSPCQRRSGASRARSSASRPRAATAPG